MQRRNLCAELAAAVPSAPTVEESRVPTQPKDPPSKKARGLRDFEEFEQVSCASGGEVLCLKMQSKST